MLREELAQKIDSVRTDLTQKIEDLTQKIETVRTELGGKIDAVQCAITEHSKSIKVLATDVKDHEGRLIHLEQHVL